jgi:putative membrane protein
MVRDSAGACLPFSQVGGFLMGARAASLKGLSWPTAIISMVVDLTAEFIAELFFAAAGLLVLLRAVSDGSMKLPIAAAIAAAIALGWIVFKLHGRALPMLVRFGQKILGDWAKGGLTGASATDLAEMYSHTGRLSAATAVHLLGWVAKGIGNWLAFRLLGAHLGLIEALAIEGLLHALLIPAFIIPGYAGVQEAGYAGLGALFGLPPEISIGVSLLRRARDIALGIPILIVWQCVEMRRLRQA